jgi:hypothetical protein
MPAAAERERGYGDGEGFEELRRRALGLPGVRSFGPEDPTSDEAAGFGAVGAGLKMRRMIEHHRRMFPAADRAILRRKWDEERTNALLDHLPEIAEALNIEGLEGAGVRGQNERNRIVTLVTRNEAGRVHKSHLPYSFLDKLPDVKVAVERAGRLAEQREKGVVVNMSASEASPEFDQLRADHAALLQRVADLEAAKDGDGDGGDGAEEGPQSVAGIKAAIEAAPEDEREALKASFRKAEEVREQPRKGVLDATEPAGD